MNERRGAVAVLDALGFKGIWKRRDPKAVLERLKTISEQATKGVEQWASPFQDESFGSRKAREVVVLHPHVAHFSDSVIFSCSAEPGPFFDNVPREALSMGSGLELFALNYVVFALSLIIAEGASQEPCFVYRGAVATGRFWLEKPSFVLGEAIDEAAAQERTAEAAVVQLCDSARRVLDEAEILCPAVVRNYPVPLKGNTLFTTHVVNPFATLPLIARTQRPGEVKNYTYFAMAKLSGRLLGFMESDDIGVQTKRKNTEQFLGIAAAQIPFGPHDS